MSVNGSSTQNSTARKITLRVSLIAVGLLILLAFMEHKPSLPGNEAESHRGPLSTGFWYEKVTRAPEKAEHVVVITVGSDMPQNFPMAATETKGRVAKGPEPEPESLKAACKRRVYIAALLDVLVNLKPKAVVLDLWFDPTYCSDQRTTETVSEAIIALSQRLPVVTGLPSYNSVRIKADWPAIFAETTNRAPGLKPSDLVLQPVTRGFGDKVTEALVERNIDARRIPLSWPVYENFEEVGSKGPHRMDTLSVAAVRVAKPDDPILNRVGALGEGGGAQPSGEEHPFTSLIAEEKLPIERAIDVICLSPSEQWKSLCESRDRRHPVEATSLVDKIVLVGLTGFGEDLHETLIGKVPGVVLQANYVESLLDGRVFKPVPFWLQIIVICAWLLLAFHIAGESRSLIISLLATILLAYPVIFVLGKIGYYTELLVELALASVTLLVSFIVHMYFEHQFG